MEQRRKVKVKDIEPELTFTAARSGGPGGQNVNKVNTKITLSFDVNNSGVLSEEEKEKISQGLASRITKEGVLMITASDKRSQLQNKAAALQKLDKLLGKVFSTRKKRKATKPPKSAHINRLDAKKKQSEKKKWRQNPQ